MGRRFDAQAHGVTLNLDDSHRDLITKLNPFTHFAAKNQHDEALLAYGSDAKPAAGRQPIVPGL